MVLVVSCSCALIISVPVSVVTAIARGARDGILIKGGIYLERLADIKAVAFDKTGTLTRGRPTLAQVTPLDGISEDEALTLAAAVETGSEHPIATAIVGGWFAHFRNPTVTTSQWWGSVGMIVSGVVLFGLAMSGEPNHMKLGVKFLIGVIVFVAALIGRRKSNRGEVVPTGLAHAVGGLGLVNILVAVLWQ